jgi:hypothetical protein
VEALLHEPVLEGAEELAPALRQRVLTVATRALERAAANAPDATIVPTGVLADERAGGAAAARPAARERLAAGGGGTDRLVPSFNGAGALVTVRIAGAVGTASGDQVVRREFSDRLVIWGSGQLYVMAGGNPYVVAGNIGRADAWGKALFHRTGYAVLQPVGTGPGDPFYAVPLRERLRWSDLGSEERPTPDAPVQAGRRAAMVSSRDYTTVYVQTSDDVMLTDTRPGALWSRENVLGEGRAVPAGEGDVTGADIDAIAEGIVREAGRREGFAGLVEAISGFDRNAFAAMPWDVRARYLQILVDAWTGEREEIAILELIHATRSIAELEAIFAVLRDRGVYRRLFRDLDGRVFELLRMLGRFRPQTEASWRSLVTILIDAGMLPGQTILSAAGIGPTPWEQLRRLGEGAEQWIESTLDAIWMLVSRPGEVIEGLGHLAELIWMLEMAKAGDRDAQAMVGRMAMEAGRGIVEAVRGLAYADELGTPMNDRGRGEHVGGDILGRLQAMIAVEILTWFIGVGEIKSALSAGSLTEKVGALLRVLRRIGQLGRFGGAGAEVAHLVALLGRIGGVDDAARALRLLELIPESHLSLLERLAREAHVVEGVSADALRAALAGRAELLRDLDRLGDVMRAAAQLEAKATQAGIQASELAPMFARLLDDAGIEPGRLARLVDEVPAANLREFADTLTFLSPRRLDALGADGLAELARRPRLMALTRDAGSEVLATMMTHTGDNWTALERLAEGLEARRRALPDPRDYQRLLDRIKRGEPGAFDELDHAFEAERLSRARAAGRVPEHLRERLSERRLTELMDELDDLPPGPIRDRFADELAQMSNKELDGLEQLARLDPDAVDWTAALDTMRAWPPQLRTDVLEIMAEVGPRAETGLETVLHGIFQRSVSTPGAEVHGMTGSLGQLYAARTAVRRYGATRMHFEVRYTGRQADIVAQTATGQITIEVKTNLQTGGALIRDEAIFDIVNHAGSRYQDLRYLYSPNVSAHDRGLIGGRMLRLFDDPAVQARLQAGGHNVAAARQAFDDWLRAGGLGVYDL